MSFDKIMEGPHPLAVGEYFLRCPYDGSHLVTNHRFIHHLQKCRKNYAKAQKEKGLEVEYGFCKFNFIHHLPSIELLYHESNCKDQFSVLKHIDYLASSEFLEFRDQEVARSREHKEDLEVAMKDWEERGLIPKEEEWDMDSQPRQPGYDPSVKMANSAVLFTPKGMTKSEKKKFRDEQRERFSGLLSKAAEQPGPRTRFVTTSWRSEIEACIEPMLEELGAVGGAQAQMNLQDGDGSNAQTYNWQSDLTSQMKTSGTNATSEDDTNTVTTDSELHSSLMSL